MKTWDIQKTQFKVADFVNWAKNQELNLSPSFQRRAVWSKGAKSYLVDSVLRGLPIPPIILRDLAPNIQTFASIREVVDGQQRLRTMLTFILPQVLNDFNFDRDHFTISRSHIKELAGKGFRDLPATEQRQILDYQFMVHIFPSETDDRDILEIFARMNATGTKLNNQELRNAEYFGEFKTAAFSVAAEFLNVWRSWRIFSEAAIARMSEVEFTSELFILVIRGINQNSKAVIDKAYNEFDEQFPEKSEVVKRVRTVLDLMHSNIASDEPGVLSSKALSYGIFACLYDSAFGLQSNLKATKARPVGKSEILAVEARAKKLLAGKGPKDAELALEARSSNAKNRRILFEYLKG
ncbi:MAG: DUF262 domain-containing protein [Planctomycetaceae bacterium]